MGRYIKIPPSFIPNTVAKAVSKLEIELQTRAQKEVGKIITKVRQSGCPKELGRLTRQVKGLQNGIGGLNKRLQMFKKLPELLLIPISALEIAAKIILSLPAPQSPTPVPGLPISITNKLTELIIVLFEFIAQKKDDAEAIVAIVDGPALRLETISKVISRVTSVVGVCRIEKELQKKLDDEELTFEQLVEKGLIDDSGNLVTSTLSRQYIGAQGGESVSDLAQEFGLTNEQVVERIKDGKNNNEEGDNLADRIFGSSKNNVDNQLASLLEKLEGLGLESVASIQKELETLSSLPIDKSLDNRFFHTGPNGIIYRLDILTDEKSPKVAPRRYAVALDTEDVVVLTGPKSFAADTDILLNEIKFRIDNQLS